MCSSGARERVGVLCAFDKHRMRRTHVVYVEMSVRVCACVRIMGED